MVVFERAGGRRNRVIDEMVKLRDELAPLRQSGQLHPTGYDLRCWWVTRRDREHSRTRPSSGPAHGVGCRWSSGVPAFGLADGSERMGLGPGAGALTWGLFGELLPGALVLVCAQSRLADSANCGPLMAGRGVRALVVLRLAAAWHLVGSRAASRYRTTLRCRTTAGDASYEDDTRNQNRWNSFS